MIARIAFTAVLAAGALPAVAQETYVLDPAHSRPTFEAIHLGFSSQFGSFQTVTGKGTLDRAAKKGALDVTIDAASVRLFDPRLEAPVKGDKFFNVEKYPTITFKSNDFKFDGDKVIAINGDLTMLGVSKPVMLKVVDFKCGEQTFEALAKLLDGKGVVAAIDGNPNAANRGTAAVGHHRTRVCSRMGRDGGRPQVHPNAHHTTREDPGDHTTRIRG